MAWWSVCSAMFWLVVSATLALNYGTVNTLIGLALSALCYSVINGIITRYAIRSGLSVGLFSRILFGNSGASLATLIFFATAIYYAVFEGSVIAVAIQHMFPALSLEHAYLLVVVYSVPLVLGSVQQDRWIVTEGLAPGDRIVTEGLQHVKVGDQVSVTPATDTAAPIAQTTAQ